MTDIVTFSATKLNDGTRFAYIPDIDHYTSVLRHTMYIKAI